MKSVCLLVQNVYDIDPRVRRKAEALVAAGFSVDVLALAPTHEKKTYSLNGVNVYTVSLGKKRGSLARYSFEYAAFLVWAFIRLLFLMRKRRYVVVDVNTLPDFLIFAALPARWMGAKLVLDMHEITPEFYISKYGIRVDSWLVKLLEFQEKISFGCADYVITINEPIQKLLEGRGLPSWKSIVVMNAVDEAHFSQNSRPAVEDDPLRPFVMVYHGTLTRVYGLDIAVEAFSLVHEHMAGAELWILGSGPEQSVLAELVQKRGLTQKVKLIGQVPAADIPLWLNKCHVGVLPIRRDIFLDFAFPNKLPEFIVMSMPVLMARLRAIRHYFSDEALSYFEPGDPAALGTKMVELYSDPRLRARLAARAKEEYAPIRWEVMKRRYLDLIERLAGITSPIAEHTQTEEIVVTD